MGRVILQIGMIPHLEKETAIQASQILLDLLDSRSLKVYLPQEAANRLQGQIIPAPWERFTHDLDYLIVLGGDGTLLQAARRTAGSGIPILGINLGHLGFLTELETGELAIGIQHLLAGHYQVEERMMLEAKLYRE